MTQEFLKSALTVPIRESQSYRSRILRLLRELKVIGVVGSEAAYCAECLPQHRTWLLHQLFVADDLYYGSFTCRVCDRYFGAHVTTARMQELVAAAFKLLLQRYQAGQQVGGGRSAWTNEVRVESERILLNRVQSEMAAQPMPSSQDQNLANCSRLQKILPAEWLFGVQKTLRVTTISSWPEFRTTGASFALTVTLELDESA